MAKLLKTPYPLVLPKFEYYPNLVAYRKAWQEHDNTFNELYDNSTKAEKNGELVGRLVGHPMGDGSAWYLVVKDKSLTLQWVPYSDCWTAPTAWVRGLRAGDIK